MKTLPAPGVRTAVTIGAGFCCALLFSLAKQQTLSAVTLAYLAPLPIMIATLGFGQVAGTGSAIIASLLIGLLATVHEETITNDSLLGGLVSGVTFALILALPAWWLGFLSCLGKPEGTQRWQIQSADKKLVPGTVYYPIGHILVHAAVLSACIVALSAVALATRFGGFDAALDQLTAKCLLNMKNYVEAHPELNTIDLRRLIELSLKTMPPAWTLIMFLGNLWLAGHIVLASNRLPRPWPNIAHELRVPRLFILVLAAALGLCALKENWLSSLGLIAAVPIALAFVLQGLAAVHDLTRNSRWRVPLLCLLYTVLILFMPLSLALFVSSKS